MKKSGETIGTIMEWHQETFPDATLEGQYKKWAEEREEYVNAIESGDLEHALEELADLVIVACGIARWEQRAYISRLEQIANVTSERFSAEALWEAVTKKMERNRKRTWKKTGKGQFHHVNKED